MIDALYLFFFKNTRLSRFMYKLSLFAETQKSISDLMFFFFLYPKLPSIITFTSAYYLHYEYA